MVVEDEQSVSIDIQQKKLLDWLISRRICNKQWHEHIVPIRAKIGHALGDMPEHPAIKELLTGTQIHYFHCRQIVEILKETEKESKTFFGSYGSQRMKDWQEVVSLYQRDQVYLAEAAQLLSQAVGYELPGLKKQLAKCVQVQEECDQREKDNHRKAHDFQRTFDQSCRQLGIAGQSIRREIIALLADLPGTYARIAEDSSRLREARQVYADFLAHTLDASVDEKDVLPTLSFLMREGNVTTYQWMYGEAPLCVEETALDFGEDDDDNEAKENDDQIDFGDDAIDFGDDATVDAGEGEGEGEGEIDWGNLDDDGAGADIDWSVSEEIAASTDIGESAGIVVEDGGVAGGVARDAEALSLLDNRRTRSLILDELAELECFLEQRRSELEEDEDGSRFTLGTTSSSAASVSVDTAALVTMIGDARALIDTLTAGKLHHLQLIRSSPSYVGRMVDGLKQKLALIEKMSVSNQAVAVRRDEAIREQAELQTKLKVMKAKVEDLQTHIEQDISKRYKNRPVNIMGGVQSV